MAGFGTDTGRLPADVAAGRRWPDRVWAVEGCNGIGRHVAQRLVADGETVVDVPAKLSARARVFYTGQGRKTDATDAHSIAVVAAAQLRPAPGPRRRRDWSRCGCWPTAATSSPAPAPARVSRLHRLLLELIPGGAPRFLSATPGQERCCATVRPRDVAGRTRRQLAAELLADIVALDRKLKDSDKRLTRGGHRDRQRTAGSLRHRPGRRRPDPRRRRGRGPVPRPRRTSPPGPAPPRSMPPPATSNDTGCPGPGTGALNRVLHIMAIVQIRHDTEGRAYYRRKLAAGKTPMEALRVPETTALRRGLPPAHRRRRDRAREAGPGGHSGATLKSSAASPTPAADSSDKSLPGPAEPQPTPVP